MDHFLVSSAYSFRAGSSVGPSSLRLPILTTRACLVSLTFIYFVFIYFPFIASTCYTMVHCSPQPLYTLPSLVSDLYIPRLVISIQRYHAPSFPKSQGRALSYMYASALKVEWHLTHGKSHRIRFILYLTVAWLLTHGKTSPDRKSVV